MPKISSYTTTPPSLTDKLIGTDTNDSSATKNFTVEDVLALSVSSNAFKLSLNGSTEDIQTGIDYTTPVVVSFGAAQVNDDVDLTASNEIVFKTTGDYLVELNLSGGVLYPSGTASTGAIYYAVFVNGVQINYTQVNRVLTVDAQTATDLDTFSNTFIYEASANDSMEVKIICPSTYGLSPFGTGIGFNYGPSAHIRVSKAN